MNQADAALNKSEISQFSLTEQKQPLGRYDDSGQNQRRQRLEIRGYNNNELLNYEKINECRQDSSRSDDHHSNHKQDNLVGEGHVVDKAWQKCGKKRPVYIRHVSNMSQLWDLLIKTAMGD